MRTAEWLASPQWALAVIGPVTGGVVPDPARAVALCAAYGLDPERHNALAMVFAERARMQAAGQVVPPIPGEGEE